MKKLTTLLAVLFILVLSSAAQHTQKWFFNLSTGLAIGGPAGSIKQNMKKNGLDDESSDIIIFIAWSNDHPVKSKYPPLLAKFGKQITDRKSWYVLAGLPASGEVNGFKKYGEFNIIIFGGSYGVSIDVPYQIYQVAAGYQFSSSQSKARWGLAPSAFIYHYSYKHNTGSQSHTAIIPGANFSARIPLGKEKRRVGVDLIAEANLAPPVKMKEVSGSTNIDSKMVNYKLPAKSANMAHGVLGIALAFRDKAPAAIKN